jgi:hypothetical protein
MCHCPRLRKIELRLDVGLKDVGPDVNYSMHEATIGCGKSQVNELSTIDCQLSPK